MPQEFQTTLPPRDQQVVAAPSRSKFPFFLLFFVLCLVGASYAAYVLTTPPAAFKANTLVEIPEGYSLQSIGKLLEERAIIRSPIFFSLLVTQSGKEKNMSAGMYLFKEPLSVFDVAKRLEAKDHGIEIKKITLPEGKTAKEMAGIIAGALPSFDQNDFMSMTAGKEGYLFPDTYFFFSTATSGPIVTALTENFVLKTKTLNEEATARKKDWEDIVIMASIIEAETVTPVDRRIVSQILWDRMAKKMRLQVDAPFMYIMGKGSLELTVLDLKSDSPYNTYTHYGLPPTPIGNPGLDTIDAALHPATTTYVYYLSDKSGLMHYAKTFEQHKINKAKYLR